MGQYYQVVNITKREYLYPHDLSDGLKLMELGCSGYGTMNALCWLLTPADTPSELLGEYGQGDGTATLRGSWAGDRIVIAGDCADEGKWLPPGMTNWTLYSAVYHDHSPANAPDRSKHTEQDFLREMEVWNQVPPDWKAYRNVSIDVALDIGRATAGKHPLAPIAREAEEGKGSNWFRGGWGDASVSDDETAKSLSELLEMAGHVCYESSKDLRLHWRMVVWHLAVFNLGGRPQFGDLRSFNVVQSEDGSRVEEVRFKTDTGVAVTWTFPVTRAQLKKDIERITKAAQTR